MTIESIILALGASFITGATSLLNTILMAKNNEKTILINSKSAIKQEFMQQKLICYKKILNCIFYIENNINNENAIKNSNIEQVWIDNYVYCTKIISKHIWIIVSGPKTNLMSYIKIIKDNIKREINEFFDIKEEPENI